MEDEHDGVNDDPRWVRRTAVLSRAASARFVLVEAPGGWGKTTLCDHLVDHLGAAPCRVRLRPATTLDALLDQIARGWRRAGAPELADAVSGAADSTDASDQMLAALTRRTEPMVLVVDDADRLDDEAAAWLRSLVDDVRLPHRVIVAARVLPPRLARRPGTGSIVVDTGDLRFGADEVAAVLATDDAERIDRVLSVTQGWPTAVHLVAAGHDVRADGSGPGAALLARVVDDVLGDEVAVVARLALVPRLTPQIAALVADTRAFDTLVSSGLPVNRWGDWWVLTDPVREVLLERLPDREAVLDADTSCQVAAFYDVAAATAFLGESGHFDALAEDIARRAWRELADLTVGQLVALTDALGPERRARWPRAVLGVARAIELRDPDRRRALIDEALGVDGLGQRERHEFEAERLRHLVARAEMDAVFAEAPALLDRLADDELAARGRALLALGIAHAYTSTPESLMRSDDALSRAAAIFRLIGESAWEADALRIHAVMVSYHGGRVALAGEQMAGCVSLLTPGSRAWAVALTYYVEILLDLGRDAEAESAARAALEVGQRLGDATVTSYAAWEMAVVRCNAGDIEGTRRWLDEVERTPGPWLEEVSGQEFLSFGADLLACLGDHAGAMVYRDRCAAMAERFGTRSMVDVVDGRIEAMYGDPVRAIEIFERLDGEPYATIRARWVRTLFRALAAKRTGERTTATHLIETAIELVTQMGLPDLPQRNEPLLVQMLADVWPGGPDGPGVDAVRVGLLGGFGVLNGVQVVTPAPGHPATLVKVLALRRTMTIEQAIDLLWPDADVTTGRQRLRNLLNRLRSQSGPVVERDGEALRLASDVAVDVDRFDAAVDAAYAAPVVERPGLARLALGAYSGDLLPADPYEDWAAAPRERLRRRYLGLVDVVAADAIERGDLDEAVRLLDLAIEREPLEEHRYVTIAEALLALGRRSAARDVVERASAVLADLGVSPGPDLVRVGRSSDARDASSSS
jgi:DNA-binding SARP family transcriptional activator